MEPFGVVRAKQGVPHSDLMLGTHFLPAVPGWGPKEPRTNRPPPCSSPSPHARELRTGLLWVPWTQAGPGLSRLCVKARESKQGPVPPWAEALLKPRLCSGMGNRDGVRWPNNADIVERQGWAKV